MVEYNGWETTAKTIQGEELVEFVEKGKNIKKTVWQYKSGDKYWLSAKYAVKNPRKKSEDAK